MLTKAFNQYRILAVAALFFLFILLINNQVRFYGDDFVYFQFSLHGFENFLNQHAEHYVKANGRALVHFFVTLFLLSQPIIWRVCAALCLTHITWLSLDILTHRLDRSKDRIWTYLFILLITASIDPLMGSQSVFWTTGSLNYLFPLWAFLGFVHAQLSDRSIGRQILFCLLSAFSVEQGSMMLLGFLVLISLKQGLGPKESWKARLLNAFRKNLRFFIISVVGLCSIVLAPSMFLRASIEKNASLPLLELINMNVITLGTTFFFSKVMFPVILSLLIAIFTFVGSQLRKGYRFTKTDTGMFITWVCSFLYAGYYYYQYIKAPHLQDIHQFSSLPMALLFIAFVYIIYKIGAERFKADNHSAGLEVVVLLTLALGSLAMMLVSPVFGFRNFLFAYFLIPLYGLYLIPENMQLSCALVYSILILIFKSHFAVSVVLMCVLVIYYFVVRFIPGAKKWGYALLLSITLIACSSLLMALHNGYKENADVYDQNIQRMVFAREMGIPYVQKELPLYAYRWIMPYENDNYAPYYNLYMNVDQNEPITWE